MHSLTPSALKRHDGIVVCWHLIELFALFVFDLWLKTHATNSPKKRIFLWQVSRRESRDEAEPLPLELPDEEWCTGVVGADVVVEEDESCNKATAPLAGERNIALKLVAVLIALDEAILLFEILLVQDVVTLPIELAVFWQEAEAELTCVIVVAVVVAVVVGASEDSSPARPTTIFSRALGMHQILQACHRTVKQINYNDNEVPEQTEPKTLNNCFDPRHILLYILCLSSRHIMYPSFSPLHYCSVCKSRCSRIIHAPADSFCYINVYTDTPIYVSLWFYSREQLIDVSPRPRR